MAVSAQQVKQLRDRTGAGMMECKRALTEAAGDMSRAITILRELGLATAAQKAKRTTREGMIGQYIHTGSQLGVLVEVNCETDFVARTEEFQELVREAAMQIAASNPRYVRRENVSQLELEREREIYRKQALATGKPEQVANKIVEGRLNKYYSEVCLYEQPYIKDPQSTFGELIQSKIAMLKENINVQRFTRFKLGEQ